MIGLRLKINRPNRKTLFSMTGVLLLAAFNLQAQETQDATWITHPDISGHEYGVYHFRKTVELEKTPEHFNVHVSADNRYRLYVNGISVVAGPQRSDVMHWRYDEVDLASYLRNGSNVIAAVVWHWGEHKPVAQHSYQTGFLIRGATSEEATIDTGATSWKVVANSAYSALPVSREQVGGYYASPPGESLDAHRVIPGDGRTPDLTILPGTTLISFAWQGTVGVFRSRTWRS